MTWQHPNHDPQNTTATPSPNSAYAQTDRPTPARAQSPLSVTDVRISLTKTGKSAQVRVCLLLFLLFFAYWGQQGRAIYVLQQTLPEFFFTGLVTSMDKATGIPRSSATSRSIPVLNANPLDYQVYADDDDVEGIYSPKVGLCYTPPVALPPPFPATLHIEGLPLYLASAVFIRHTLNALYVDLKLELRKCIVNTPRLPTSAPMSAPTSILGPTTTPEPTPMPWQKQNPKNKRGSSREKSLVVGFCVTGTSRVSGAPAEWEVTSTYTFSPLSGLIDKHIINSIYPAPHQAVYDALRTSLGKVFGFGMEGEEQGLQERRQEGAGAAACAAAAGIGINTRVGG
ncbi:hypothetical protein C0989_006235 [Termitomyces sp. Mn162]|nr:hypothetical protein C0989_006235 [Termitomyces sp. Mn162]